MRDIFLVAAIGLGLIGTLRNPFVGILLWAWFTCMVPNQETFGFAQTAPLNLIVVVVTVLAWLVSREPKFPPLSGLVVALFMFLIWMTINGFLAVDPAWSWPLWDRTWKIIALGLMIIPLASTKSRMHALVWVVVLSLVYYGIKGGAFTILMGGGGKVMGPDNSTIGDNNHLAVALAMILPLANYLRMHTADRRVRYALLGGIALSAIAILGTYSRGGLVTLAGLAAMTWLRTRNRLVYPIAAALVLVPVMWIMPQAYDDRIATLKTADSDQSFQGRVTAWHVAWDYASDHFPFGDGFSGAELPQVYNRYYPGVETHAAHSIYFQVLGDNGFPGLVIYLAIILGAFFASSRTKSLARGSPDLRWAYDLADMMQLSIFAFCIGGSALSLAYYDVFFIEVGLAVALRVYVAKRVAKERPAAWRKRNQPSVAKPSLAAIS